MKMLKYHKILLLLFASFNLLFFCAAAQEYRTIEQNAFDRGEYLEYKVYWDAWGLPNIRAGVASFTVTPDNKQFGNRNTFHVVTKGESRGMLNMFYKVNDRYESYFDEDAIIPWYFERRTKEGSYERDDDVVFEHHKNMVTSSYATKTTPDNVQDFISALYYARTMDFSSFEQGDFFDVNFFLDDSVYMSRVQFDGRDTIKTGVGTFSCLKFKPMVLVGPVFDQPYPMTLWVTDDENRIPVFAESKVSVGSVKIEITYFEGLNNPLISMIEIGKREIESQLQSRHD